MCSLHCRVAAAHLAAECGRAGQPHLAALLLHASLGATMRQQYRLVLYTKLQQLQQRAGRAAASAPGSQQEEQQEQCAALESALQQLCDPLDAQLLRQLAGWEAAGQASQAAAPAAKGRRRGAGAAAAATCLPPEPVALVAALEAQAEEALGRWVGSLPQGTVVCSLSSQPGLSIAGGRDERLVVSRIAAGAPPLVLQLPVPAEEAGGGLAQHPIKALSMEPEAAGSGSG